MNITMIGSGYVGLVSGACFAEFGASVTCLDIDKNRISRLNNGEVPIYEPGLAELMKKNAERLAFTDSCSEAVGPADLVFICVGTPSLDGNGEADLRYVYQAVKDLAPHLSGYTVVVDKSTVPVGTAREVHRIIREVNPDADFDVASNPEFLREGAAISDFMQPDRVVLGVDSERAGELLQQLYRPHMLNTPILQTDIESAELIKYASNTFLAAKVTFINEISAICEKSGGNILDVAEGMGLDRRIGKEFLRPGPGIGGSCFPKDARALNYISKELGVPSHIINGLIEGNDAQKARMTDKIRNALGGEVQGKRIAVLGLTFKPDTDDVRESPALVIVPALAEAGAEIVAHDPQGMKEAQKELPEGIVYAEDAYEAMQGADAVVLMTEWQAYRDLDFARMAGLVRGKVFIDLRNVYDLDRMKQTGFAYYSVGRPGIA
ncbi:MAG: UDP-glucose/GDP-mannose dehydrogenase family protein [Gammaproteobacteria bacterium]